MTLLDRYLARTIFAGTLLVLAVLLALSAFLNLIGQADDIGVGGYTLAHALRFVAASLPQQAYEMFPIAILVGTLIGLGNLASGNELVVMRAAGLSLWRLARSLLVGGALVASLCVAIGEFIAPPAERYAKHHKTLAMYQHLTLTARQGIWLKDGGRYINVRHMRDEGSLHEVYVFEVDPEGALVRLLRAASASFENGRWTLKGVRETRFTPAGAQTSMAQERSWDTSLDPGLLDLFVVDYKTLSTRALAEYIRFLHTNGLDASVYELSFWTRIVTPFSMMVLAVLALPFVFGPLRSVGAGQRIVVGMLVGVVFYLVNHTFMSSGQVFGLNPFVIAWTPTLLLAAGALVAIRLTR
ncbi:MAG TPA: LPS export ABC transporter permease LptG [Gammaproteobacteria bacterium]|nr:LPS export ABC transporter permease LptG [Gammaproteobacteria bacterium]